jgi:hypothetical protein
MKYEASKCEYIIKVKLSDTHIVEGESSAELRKEITKKGKETLKKYLEGNLFDPDKKIIFEDTTFNLKEL